MKTSAARRSFDPVAVGQAECDSWAAYYRHEWGTFLHSAVAMVAAMLAAADLRVTAMGHSDGWVQAGCDPSDPLLAEERRALVASFTALRDAVDRQAA